jgi:hypothetical protein
MREPELFLLFVRPLNRAGIRYVTTGSVAAIFYGEPRLTHDVDFVVSFKAAQIKALTNVFSREEFYVPPVETILAETRREQRGHFNIIHMATGFKADMYLTGRDALNAWAFRLQRQVQYEGESIALAPLEYVIIRKLEYYREGASEKHLRDIRSMLDVSRDQVDSTALNEWITRLGLQTEWQLIGTGPDAIE